MYLFSILGFLFFFLFGFSLLRLFYTFTYIHTYIRRLYKNCSLRERGHHQGTLRWRPTWQCRLGRKVPRNQIVYLQGMCYGARIVGIRFPECGYGDSGWGCAADFLMPRLVPRQTWSRGGRQLQLPQELELARS